MNPMRTLPTMSVLVLLPIAALATPGALEVRFQPGDVVYAYPIEGVGAPAGLFTAVIQNVAFVNRTATPMELDTATIEVRRGDDTVQSVIVDHHTLQASTAKLHAYGERGLLELYDSHFQTSRYLEGVAIADSTTVAPGAAVIVLHRALLFQELPDHVTVTVRARDSRGKTLTGEGTLEVVLHESPNDYHLPVKGRWVVAAAPSLHGHHRWASIQEFAVDLIRIGTDGLSHRGDGTALRQYYAYGRPVYAAADGVVVSVRGNLPESDDNLQRPGESATAYAERVARTQHELLAKGFEFVLGNHVVLRHAGGEHSHYLHLEEGSVAVKEGDAVTRGQKIGAVGHSGNSTEPHLHFHVTDGPGLSHSRSIPVTFSNLTLWPDDDGTIRYLQSGQVVIAR